MDVDAMKKRAAEQKEQRIEALKEAIEHWQVMAADPRSAYEDGHVTNYQSCALCERYYHNSCWGCPVSHYTRENYCNGTPYGDANVAFLEVAEDGKKYTKGRKRKMREEIDFLEFLLETEQS